MPNDTSSKLGGAVRPYFGGRRGPSPKFDAEATAEAPPKEDTPREKQPVDVPPVPESRQPITPSESPLSTPPPEVQPQRDVRTVVREAAADAGWSVMEMGSDFQIDVTTAGRRSQIVTVSFDRHDKAGLPVLVLASLCGAFDEQHAAQLLRYNSKLPYGAFAAERTAQHQEMIVLRATLPAVGLAALPLRHVLAEIAARADKVENTLTGRDQF